MAKRPGKCQSSLGLLVWVCARQTLTWTKKSSLHNKVKARVIDQSTTDNTAKTHPATCPIQPAKGFCGSPRSEPLAFGSQTLLMVEVLKKQLNRTPHSCDIYSIYIIYMTYMFILWQSKLCTLGFQRPPSPCKKHTEQKGVRGGFQ